MKILSIAILCILYAVTTAEEPSHIEGEQLENAGGVRLNAHFQASEAIFPIVQTNEFRMEFSHILSTVINADEGIVTVQSIEPSNDRNDIVAEVSLEGESIDVLYEKITHFLIGENTKTLHGSNWEVVFFRIDITEFLCPDDSWAEQCAFGASVGTTTNEPVVTYSTEIVVVLTICAILVVSTVSLGLVIVILRARVRRVPSDETPRQRNSVVSALPMPTAIEMPPVDFVMDYPVEEVKNKPFQIKPHEPELASQKFAKPRGFEN